jgi:YesN/AraC family two-component response regulator
MKKRSVLIVDDEDIILASLGRDLGLDIYRVETASSGEEALEKLRQGKFDLVISDYMMPGINGLELLKMVKSNDPHIVFIILTGYGDSVSTLRILENGADEMLLKPCDTDELMLRMDRCLRIQDALRRLECLEELPLCGACGASLAQACGRDRQDP